MKKLSIAIILTICLISVIALSACSGGYKYTPIDATVRYMTNVAGETIQLSSGREVIAENVVYHSEAVKTGDILTPPEKDPVRVGYVFKGWATDKEATELYDFTKPVTGSLNLYAKWERSSESQSTVNYSETRLSFVEQIDNSTPFALTKVCNQPIQDGAVNLTTSVALCVKRLMPTVVRFTAPS